MLIETRQRTISVKLAGESEWTTRHFGGTLPKLDPYAEIPADVEEMKPDIKDLRDFFVEHGAGKIGHGLSKNAPEMSISVDGIDYEGRHVIKVRTDEISPGDQLRSLEHRFYLFPNNVGIRSDVDFLMKFSNRLSIAPDLSMSESVVGQKFVTHEDLIHLNYVKTVLQQG